MAPVSGVPKGISKPGCFALAAYFHIHKGEQVSSLQGFWQQSGAARIANRSPPVRPDSIDPAARKPENRSCRWSILSAGSFGVVLLAFSLHNKFRRTDRFVRGVRTPPERPTTTSGRYQ